MSGGASLKTYGLLWWREALKYSIVLADDYGLMSR
jgi:hypothetical protein